jgi:hypothetical protein
VCKFAVTQTISVVALLARTIFLDSWERILSSSARILSAPKPVLLAMCMTRPIEFVQQEITVRHRICGVRHVEVVVEAIQFLRLRRRWRQRMHAHSLLLRVLRREAEIDWLLVRERVAVGLLLWLQRRNHRCSLRLTHGWRLGTLSRVLSATALGPACCAVALHDRRAVTACAAIEAALLANRAGVLVRLVVSCPAVEVECRLYIWLFEGRLGDIRLEGVQMAVLSKRIA